jgi:hypothetical protein
MSVGSRELLGNKWEIFTQSINITKLIFLMSASKKKTQDNCNCQNNYW